MISRRAFTRNLLPLMVAIVGASIGACRPTPAVPPSASGGPALALGWPQTVIDDTGAEVTLRLPPKRIVSLAPSNTEILFALGEGDTIVADTESCDYPPEARNRPHIGGMNAGDLERIEVALPDLVVAVGSINQKLVMALRAAHIPALVVQPRTIKDVMASIQLIGRATGREEQAHGLAVKMEERINNVRAVTARATFRPKTLIAYSANPIYTSPPDSFIHDLIGVAGGEDVVHAALPQNIISSAVVIERAPDVIICSRTLRDQLRSLPGWEIVPAVRTNRFFTPDEDVQLTRPGPRIAGAVEMLARYLHPEFFPVSESRATQ